MWPCDTRTEATGTVLFVSWLTLQLSTIALDFSFLRKPHQHTNNTNGTTRSRMVNVAVSYQILDNDKQHAKNSLEALSLQLFSLDRSIVSSITSVACQQWSKIPLFANLGRPVMTWLTALSPQSIIDTLDWGKYYSANAFRRGFHHEINSSQIVDAMFEESAFSRIRELLK